MRKPPSPVIDAKPKRISPTQVEIARACPLQAVLNSLSPNICCALPSSSAARYVGSAFHGLIESVRRGQAGAPPISERLPEIWNAQIDAAEEQAKLNGDECWLPLRDSYASFERSRLRAFALALSQTVTPVTTGVGPGVTETFLESRDGLVAGRLDAIDTRDSQVVLRDFKSGLVTTPDGQLKSSYRLQMILYAALYFEDRGNWPDHLELVDRSGQNHEIPFSQEEATSALSDAKEVLKGITDGLTEGNSLSDSSIADMANPSDQNCRFCQHRPSCKRYMSELHAQGIKIIGHSDFGPADLMGRLVRVGEDAGRTWLQLEHNGRVRTVRGLISEITSESEKREMSVEAGAEDMAGVFNVTPRRRLSESSDGNLFVACSNTMVYSMEAAY